MGPPRLWPSTGSARGARDLGGEAAQAARTVAGQAQIARRPRPDRAADRGAGAVLRLRRRAVLLLRRRAAVHRRTPPRRLRAAFGALQDALCRNHPAHREAAKHFRPAIHRRLSGAVPISAAWCGAHLPSAAFVQSSSGVTVTDLDGNRFYDLSGSYGVNVLGYDFYKEAIERGAERVRELGPVLGPYHPADRRERETSEGDFRARRSLVPHVGHRSGDAGGAARALPHRRSHLVRFCGAYHGWWGDVQPGIGNPVPAHETYTLADMSEKTLRVLRRGATSPACWSIRCRPCIRTPPRRAIPRWSTAPAARISTRTPMPTGSSACGGLHRAQHRSDLRRGVCRLPPRQRRRAGAISACAPISSPTARRSAADCRSASSADEAA
jgi:hypothetical protein